jgi:curved DNA-binding protein CbpA
VTPPPDPYKTLGVSPNASDAELRSAYRRLVRLHHPDHNGGSVESARRFEEVQEAYARIRELRKKAAPSPPPHADPDIDARLRDIERDLREAQQARERARQAREQARQAAREAAAAAGEERAGRPGRATDEELGYVTTDDSFSKIVSDVWDELSDRFSEAREHPAVKRVEDLIDELEHRARPKQ